MGGGDNPIISLCTCGIMPIEWWKPEGLREGFMGKDSNFQRVLLPLLTTECFHKMGDISDHYKLYGLTMGVPYGACDEST